MQETRNLKSEIDPFNEANRNLLVPLITLPSFSPHTYNLHEVFYNACTCNPVWFAPVLPLSISIKSVQGGGAVAEDLIGGGWHGWKRGEYGEKVFIIRGGRHERPVYREGDTSVGGTIRPRQGQEGVTVEAAIARNHVSYAVWSRNVIISRLGSARLGSWKRMEEERLLGNDRHLDWTILKRLLDYFYTKKKTIAKRNKWFKAREREGMERKEKEG